MAAQRRVGNLAAAAPPLPLAELVARVSHGALRLSDNVGDGRGRGLVAARPLQRLEELLEEEATAWLPAHLGDELSGALIPGLLEFVPEPEPAPSPEGSTHADDGGLRERLRSLLRLEPFRLGEPLSAGSATGAVDAGLSLVDVLAPLARRNALGVAFDDNLPSGERDLMVLAPALLMANHSCAPNAVAAGHWNGRAPAVRLVAERNVAEGEEVTISYVPRSAPRAVRQAALQRAHGFVCACARCGVAPSAAELEREREQQWLSAELPQLGAPLWRLRPAERCARVEAVLASRAAAERGALALWEVALLAGHVNALAGRAEPARRSYAEACALAAALFGSGSHRARVVAEFVGDRCAATEREVIAFETLRAQPAFARWPGLPEGVYARWRRPVLAEAEPGGKPVPQLAKELAELGRAAHVKAAAAQAAVSSAGMAVTAAAAAEARSDR